MTTIAGEPPTPDQRIHTLYVWIAIHPDGGEGIISADLPVPFGKRHVPLMHSKRRVADKMETVARAMEKLATEKGRPFKAELRAYTLGTPTTGAPTAPTRCKTQSQ